MITWNGNDRAILDGTPAVDKQPNHRERRGESVFDCGDPADDEMHLRLGHAANTIGCYNRRHI